MNAMECLLTRRSIRKYKSDPIPRETLEEILAAACCAPSAVNMQHWHFVVIQSPDRMAEFREVMRRVMVAFHPVLEDRFQKHPETIKETESFLVSLGGAPVVVLAFFLKDDYPDRDGAMQSVSAAIENLMLAAWDKGVGSCWMSAAQRMGFGPEIQAKYAPGKGEFVSAIALGYPDQGPKMPPRREGRCVFL